MSASSFVKGDEVRLIHAAFDNGAIVGQLAQIKEVVKTKDVLLQIVFPSDALDTSQSLVHQAVVLQQCDDRCYHCTAVQQSVFCRQESAEGDESDKLVALTLILPSTPAAKVNKLDMQQRAQDDESDRSSSEEPDQKPRLPISTMDITIRSNKQPHRVRLAMPPLDASQRYWLETNIRPRLSDQQRKMLSAMDKQEQLIVLYHFFQAQERALSTKYRRH